MKRYIAAECVSAASLGLVHAQHQLWRAMKTFRDGLTTKEYELLHRKYKEMDEIQQLLSKVSHRLRQSGQCV